jgi:hypothetical protein
LAYTQVYEIIATGLHEYLDMLQSKLNLIGDAISETFFGLAPVGITGATPAAGGPEGDVLSWHQSQGGPGRDS